MAASINPAITPEVIWQWKIVRDFVAGEKRVKDRGTDYLPKKSGSSDEDYEAYKCRGKVGSYTGEALNTLHGQLMRKQPVVDVSEDEELKKCLENFNREGDSFYQFASDVARDNLQTAFGGILLDMPKKPDAVCSVYDAEREGLRPYARYYAAETILDWRYKIVHGVKVLCMVKLEELVEEDEEMLFSHNLVKQYRILYLDKGGVYNVKVVRDIPQMENGRTQLDGEGIPLYSEIILFDQPVKIQGENLTYIPFFFTPYKNPETSLLYGIAELQKHYYMQSCDYENGVHMTTVPTGYVTGHLQEKDNNGYPVPIYLGKDVFLVFPEPDAKVGVLQFSGEGIEHCESAISQTLEQIGILGTRALSPDKAMSETSDAAKIHRTGENCKLSTYSKNLGAIFTRVLQTMAKWLGVEGHVAVQFNTDFDSIAFDPNALNAIANLSREGKYPLPLVFEALKKGEYLPNDMDFREFGMLVSLEASGADISEVIDFYQKLRSGEKLEITQTKSVVELNADRANNSKAPDETKQVSLENGKS